MRNRLDCNYECWNDATSWAWSCLCTNYTREHSVWLPQWTLLPGSSGASRRDHITPVLASCTGFRCASESTSNSAVWCTSRCLGKLLSTWWTTFSLSLTADDVGCNLPVTEPVSFHGPIIVSATEVYLLLDPEYGMLYLQNYDTTSTLDFLGANWSRICLSRAFNHGALWHRFLAP